MKVRKNAEMDLVNKESRKAPLQQTPLNATHRKENGVGVAKDFQKRLQHICKQILKFDHSLPWLDRNYIHLESSEGRRRLTD